MKNINSKLVRSLLLVSSLLVSSFSANADLMLSFSESDVDVKLNESFSIDVYVNTQTPSDSILSWGLDAVFNNGILSLDSFNVGSEFLQGFSADGDNFAGTSTLPSGIFGSNILLGTLNFTAIGLGSTTLNTANTLGDLFEGFTTTNFFTPSAFNSAIANIEVTTDTSGTVSASAPATISLFAIAGLALFGFRRKA